MKGKIGLSLAFTGTNYGALWQAYATQQKIQEFGFETEIINYQKAKSMNLFGAQKLTTDMF